MDDAGPGEDRHPVPDGRLTRDMALGLLARGDELMAAGEFADAGAHYARVIGYDDREVTAAALLGVGEARYRSDDEDGAVATWEAVLEVGETASTYKAWRNLAAANVRAGVLSAAIRAYREADRRAPPEDKAEIAARLGWLAKETGDPRSARRYFARSRGDGPLVPLSTVLIATTTIISLVVMFTAEGDRLGAVLALDKAAVADGEYWRLWTVTLVHADPFHLLFNMYALYLAGPIVERWYGQIPFLVFYLTCAAAGSVASFVFSGDGISVGASGAIFGLFGVLLAAGRLHHPIDRSSRTLVSQLGVLILINIVFGFASGAGDTGLLIDNAAHLGGLAAGLWLGAILPPTRVPTLSSLWVRGGVAGAAATGRPTEARRVATPLVFQAAAVGVVGVAIVVGIVIGNAEREDGSVAGGGTPMAAVLESSAVAAGRWTGTAAGNPVSRT
jgi:rhomboid protease GluP